MKKPRIEELERILEEEQETIVIMPNGSVTTTASKPGSPHTIYESSKPMIFSADQILKDNSY